MNDKEEPFFMKRLKQGNSKEKRVSDDARKIVEHF